MYFFELGFVWPFLSYFLTFIIADLNDGIWWSWLLWRPLCVSNISGWNQGILERYEAVCDPMTVMRYMWVPWKLMAKLIIDQVHLWRHLFRNQHERSMSGRCCFNRPRLDGFFLPVGTLCRARGGEGAANFRANWGDTGCTVKVEKTWKSSVWLPWTLAAVLMHGGKTEQVGQKHTKTFGSYNYPSTEGSVASKGRDLSTKKLGPGARRGRGGGRGSQWQCHVGKPKGMTWNDYFSLQWCFWLLGPMKTCSFLVVFPFIWIIQWWSSTVSTIIWIISYHIHWIFSIFFQEIPTAEHMQPWRSLFLRPILLICWYWIHILC